MRLLENKDIENYKIFLENHERCNFQQSLEWGNVKTNWKKEVILSEDENGNIRGTLCVWIRKIPLFGNIMYSARGPVCDLKSDEKFRNLIIKHKFKIKDDSKDFKDEIQPRFVFRLNLKGKTEDEIFSAFHQKTRYNIRLATKKGVTIKEGTKEDLKAFHNIMVETGERDNFLIRSLSYFEKMYDEMAPNHMKLLMAYYENEPIAGIIPIMYGNKTWYLYGASSNKHRNLMPNYLLQWTMIKQAIENKCDIYDFRGVSGVVDETHPQYGLYRFKKGFNAEFTEFIGEIYIPYKPIKYKIYKLAEKTFRTLRTIKRNINEKIRNK